MKTDCKADGLIFPLEYLCMRGFIHRITFRMALCVLCLPGAARSGACTSEGVISRLVDLFPSRSWICPRVTGGTRGLGDARKREALRNRIPGWGMVS